MWREWEWVSPLGVTFDAPSFGLAEAFQFWNGRHSLRGYQCERLLIAWRWTYSTHAGSGLCAGNVIVCLLVLTCTIILCASQNFLEILEEQDVGVFWPLPSFQASDLLSI